MAYQFDQSNSILPLPWTVDYQPDGNSGLVNLVTDGYDPAKPLVFLVGPPAFSMPTYDEPGLCWSTYIGADGNEHGRVVRTDSDGNIFVAGQTSSTLFQFPANPGLVLSPSGNYLAFLSRFTSDFQLSWAAFIGGEVGLSTSEALALAIDDNGPQRIFIGGVTLADDFHTESNGSAFYVPTGDNDTEQKGFISEFDEFGELHWSTYFGAEHLWVHGLEVVPSTGTLLATGITYGNLPEVQYGPPAGALDQPWGGSQDAFIAYFDDQRQLYVCSFFGGALWDGGLQVRTSGSSIYMVGNSENPELDMVDPGGGAYFEEHQGSIDCFIMELSLTGVVVWSTYFGGTGDDQVGWNGLFVGPERDIFVCGWAGAAFPSVPGPNWYDNLAYAGRNGFIARFSGTDRAPLWFTYLGGGFEHYCHSIVQDGAGMISVAGWSTGEELPYTQAAGWYDQATLADVEIGSFLVRFTDEQVLEQATWFGGDATTTRTQINALAPYDMGVFATGAVWKYPGDPLSYWPLDDGGGDPWFDDVYNTNSTTAYVSDAFLTLFCSELQTGFESPVANESAEVRLAVAQDAVTVLGLLDGSYGYTILDAAGRVVAQATLTSQGGRTSPIEVGQLSVGPYVLAIPGIESIKINRL